MENYFFMTVLQFLNAFFYFFIFPFLIKTLGREGYGVYVFSLSIVAYCGSVINFGFASPGVKVVAENQSNKQIQSVAISSVVISQICIFLIITPVFAGVVYLFPVLRENSLIIAICYTQIIAQILFQSWFFQGIQKMRIVTLIQLITKLFSLIFIFSFIKTSNDVWLFALISSCATLLGGTIAFMMAYREGIRVQWVSFVKIKSTFRDALPFFFSNLTATIKWQTNATVLGIFFTMNDVAMYDLAYKIISIPTTLLNSISGALFPKVIKEYRTIYVKKLIKFNALLAIGALIVTVAFGKCAVILLGGEQMMESYYFVVILSIIIFSWILVIAYINFLFIPNKLYYVVTKNQLVALISYCIVCFSIIIAFNSIYAVVIAMVVSGIAELIYCNIVIKQKKLMK
jgi:PST family polysaccharide transporter